MTRGHHIAVVLGDGRVARASGPAVPLWVPLDFEGAQANAFHLPRASEETFAAGGFIGDVRLGGSANCRVLTLAPHGNGTHTESALHIHADGPPVAYAVPAAGVLAQVLRVPTTLLGPIGETVEGTSAPDDRVVSRQALLDALARCPVPTQQVEAWVVDAILDDGRGDLRPWSGSNPPYMTLDAMRLLRERGIDHVVTNLPSVDREEDGGGLAAHHAFFGVERQQPSIPADARRRTITEMASLRRVAEGWGLLLFEVPPFVSDAAPSRPHFVPLTLADPPTETSP